MSLGWPSPWKNQNHYFVYNTKPVWSILFNVQCCAIWASGFLLTPSRFSMADETWHNDKKGQVNNHFCHCKPSSEELRSFLQITLPNKKDLSHRMFYCNVSKCNGNYLCPFLPMLKVICLNFLQKTIKSKTSELCVLLNLWHTLQKNKSDQISIKTL